jgi:hypothetical protein
MVIWLASAREQLQWRLILCGITFGYLFQRFY